HSFSYRINIPQPGAFLHPARRKSAGGGESSSGPRPARHLHTFPGVIGLALIAILSDFGQTEYVGILRGVIQRLAPGTTVTDLYMAVGAQSGWEGPWVVKPADGYFPEDTICVCVGAPGVGSDRRAVAIRTRRYFFVGPDNGLLFPAVTEDGLKEAVQ